MPDEFLGWKVHQKGTEAYQDLLKYSYTDGKKFFFKYDKDSKKGAQHRIDSEWCKSTCIPASDDEISLFRTVLEALLNLDVRNGRTFVQQANLCTNYDESAHMYKLIVDRQTQQSRTMLSKRRHRLDR